MPLAVMFADQRKILQVHVGVADQVTEEEFVEIKGDVLAGLHRTCSYDLRDLFVRSRILSLRLPIGQLTAVKHVLDSIFAVHAACQICSRTRFETDKAKGCGLNAAQIRQCHRKVLALRQFRIRWRR